MPEANGHINIELRSEEIQDILTRAPKWMIRWGNSILILIILAALVLSYFIKYPDVIPGRAVISTKTPPVYISSKVSGRIGRLLIQNGQIVEKGNVIAEIDNPVPYSSIQYLESFLASGEVFLEDSRSYQLDINDDVNLYDATPNYLSLKNSLSSYHAFLFDKSAAQNLYDLRTKKDNYLKIREITVKEIELSKVDIAYAEEIFKMQKQEFEQGYVSKLEFLNAQSAYNQSLKSQEAIKKSVIQMDMTLADYQTQINEFAENQKVRLETYRNEIIGLTSSLQNYIIRWKNDFTIKAPLNGRIDFLSRVKTNQLIKAGDELFAIVSPNGEYEVELQIPSNGFGKVKIGQEIKLKLDNFPYNEFGLINANVTGLPVLPNQDTYKLKAELTNGLNSSYGIDVRYSPEMMASAEIITEDLRLIERLFNSLRSIFSQ